MYEYITNGTCSTKIYFDIKDGKAAGVSFENGCSGNLKALSILTEGMEAREVIKKLKGLHCGSKKTSCGDQLARALEMRIENKTQGVT